MTDLARLAGTPASRNARSRNSSAGTTLEAMRSMATSRSSTPGPLYSGSPSEREARDRGIDRCIWGERSDSGRPGARGYTYGEDASAQLELAGGELCSSCELLEVSG